MGFDLYSGSLGKFIARDFLSPQAKAAKASGANFTTISMSARPSREISNRYAEEVINALKGVDADLGLDWNEGNETYLSEQLHEECFTALIHHSVRFSVPDYNPPKKVSEMRTPDVFKLGLSRDDYIGGPVGTFECQFIFRGDESLTFMFEHPGLGRGIVTTYEAVKADIERMSKILLTETDNLDEIFNMGPPQNGQLTVMVKSLPFMKTKPKTIIVEDEVLHAAKYALACYDRVFRFALKHGYPIFHDR